MSTTTTQGITLEGEVLDTAREVTSARIVRDVMCLGDIDGMSELVRLEDLGKLGQALSCDFGMECPAEQWRPLAGREVALLTEVAAYALEQAREDDEYNTGPERAQAKAERVLRLLEALR